MKFNEKYPEVVRPHAERHSTPPETVWVTPVLGQTWRLSACSICHQLTGWREISENVSVVVCSEECLQVILTPLTMQTTFGY